MKYAPWVLVLAFFFTTMVQSFLYANARRELRIEQANTRAALDTTRTYLADSVRAYSRLVEQREVENDELSTALRAANDDREATVAALTRARVLVDSLVRVAQNPVRDTVLVTPAGDSLRVAVFEHEGPPIHGEQTVRVSRDITLESRLSVSPFTLTYALGCGGPGGADAVVTWETPAWVQADVTGAPAVDPRVCSPASPGLFSIDAGDGISFAAGVVTTLLLMMAAN